MTASTNHTTATHSRKKAAIGLGSLIGDRLKDVDPLVVARKIMWNVVLLFLGLFVGFVVIQHAMFYSFPPDLESFLYVRREVYVVFSVAFALSIKSLFFIEGKIRRLTRFQDNPTEE